MADHGAARYEGPETIEELTEERVRTWSGFTHSIVAAVVISAVVLIGMAVFLL